MKSNRILFTARKQKDRNRNINSLDIECIYTGVCVTLKVSKNQKGLSGVFICTKNEQKYFCISAVSAFRVETKNYLCLYFVANEDFA